MLTHSYSSLNLFENCPLRYYRQRVLKDVIDPGGEAAHYGTMVHKHFEYRIKDKYRLPKELSKHEPLCVAMESLAEEGEMYAEIELGLDKNLKPCNFNDENVYIRGIVDVLVIPNEHTAFIFDWKTGKRRPDSFQLKLTAGMLFRHYSKLQQVVSAYVWLKESAVDREKYSRNKEIDIWKDILTRVKRIEVALEKNVWPAKPSGLCRYCPARTSCEFAQL